MNQPLKKRIVKTRVEKGSLIVSERVKVVVWRRESDAGESPLSLASLPARRLLENPFNIHGNTEKYLEKIVSYFFVHRNILSKIFKHAVTRNNTKYNSRAWDRNGNVETSSMRWHKIPTKIPRSILSWRKSILNIQLLLLKLTKISYCIIVKEKGSKEEKSELIESPRDNTSMYPFYD